MRRIAEPLILDHQPIDVGRLQRMHDFQTDRRPDAGDTYIAYGLGLARQCLLKAGSARSTTGDQEVAT